MPVPRKPQDGDILDDVKTRLEKLEAEFKAFLDAFADLDENRNRSVRETLAKVKQIALDAAE